MRQSTIRRLQEQLRLIAHYGGNMPMVTVDGIYDEQTENAVRAFQKLFGLPETGQTDFDTWETIHHVFVLVNERLAESAGITPFPEDRRTVKEGEESPFIGILKIMLNAVAERYGNLLHVPVSGIYDAETADAIRVLQRINELEPSGETDKRTWNALARLYNQE